MADPRHPPLEGFDEWLDEWAEEPARFRDSAIVAAQYPLLLKLVRAQAKMIDKLFARLGQEPGSVIVLGPNARKLADEIEELEMALMGEK